MSGREKAVEVGDPYEFVAARYPIADGVDGDATMARCVVEEYALMGFAPERVVRLFQIPTYTATYGIQQRRGAAFVNDIIASVFGRAPLEIRLVDNGGSG